MSPPNATTRTHTDGNMDPDLLAGDTTESGDTLPELVTGLWLALARHLDATVDAIRLDIKLAVSSLMALLITGIVVAALLLGLWFLSMGLIFVGLAALQVPKVVALLLIVAFQLLLLFCCHRFSKRLLANFNFQATRAAMPGAEEG